MSRLFKLNFLRIGVALGVALTCHSALACAACFGNADGPLASGLNWGIFSLLGVVVCVLGGIASFFIFLARKAAAATSISKPELAPGDLTVSTQKA